MQADISESDMSTMEKFVVLLKDRTSGIMRVSGGSRKYLFTQKGRGLENVPI